MTYKVALIGFGEAARTIAMDGRYFDGPRRYVGALNITPGQRHAIFEGNARRVFPRLGAKLKERGL